MSREIKFRAWNSIVERMSDPHTLEEIHKEDVQFQNLTFMQYTGLRDKNGVEIYEGDILGCVKFSLPVKFHEHQGRWFANDHGAYVVWPHKFKLLEVIGNIYENKELLNA